MAASHTKQETYRQLMKEQKAKSASTKIEHPLAKYNSLNQLICIICNTHVKSEILWKTHLLSKLHKENVKNLKTSSPTPDRPHEQSLQSSDSNDNDVKSSQTKKRSHSNSEDTPSPKRSKEEDVEAVSLNSEGLPSDFFDAQPDTKPNKEETNEDETNNEKEEEQKGDLPEGFFDDPKMDAKVRKVEFKDPLDEQWEAFQKSITKESEVSDAIIEVDDTEMVHDREFDELKEQIECYNRAEKLRLKQETFLASRHIKKESVNVETDQIKEEESSGSDEADLSDLLNWRFKSS